MAANNSTNTRSKGKTDSRVEINRADRERIIRIVSENYHHHVGQKMSRSKLKKAISHQLGHVTESRIIGESIKSVYGSTVTISSRKVKAHGPIKSMSFYIGLCARDSCNVTSRSGDSPARQAEAVCATEFITLKPWRHIRFRHIPTVGLGERRTAVGLFPKVSGKSIGIMESCPSIKRATRG